MLWHWLRTLAFLRRRECFEAIAELAAAHRLRQQVMADHPGFVVENGTILLGYDRDRLDCGKGRVAAGSVLSFGDPVTGYGRISIGENTWIGQYNNLRASQGADVAIGRDCLVSQFCSLVAANHRTDRHDKIVNLPLCAAPRGVRIQDDVWLGANVVITPGVTVRTGAVVGAGSVVTHDVPEYEIWAGVPARRIGARS